MARPGSSWIAGPFPVALGLAAGVALHAAGTPPLVGVPVVLAGGAASLARERRLRRGGDGSAWRALRRETLAVDAARRARLRVLALLLVAAAAGQLRMAAWEARPDPLADHAADHALPAEGDGEPLELWSGRSDGRTLRLDEPAGARVALSPVGRAPSGWVALRGRLVRPEGVRTPGGFDYAAYLRRRGIDWQLRIDEVVAHEPVQGPRERLRARAQRALARGLDPPAAALVAAMTLGVRDDLGELRERFAAAGLAHLLALSGLHVGVLAGALAWLLRPLGRLRAPLLLAALLGFVLLVGPTPSVVRAAVMAAAGVLALARGVGRADAWNALGLAGSVGLLAQPAWLFDLGFQLSYLAVLGLLLLAGPLARLVERALAPGARGPLPRRDPRALAAAGLAASVAAQAYALPLVLASFGQLPLLSPFVNLAGVPLASLLVPLGFGSALLGALHEPLATLPNVFMRPLANALLALAERAAGGPQLVWGELRPPGALVYALALAALTAALRGAWRARSALPVLLAALAYGALPAPVTPEVVVLDVGQGDATLVRLPGRREVLIDGGGTPFGDFDVGARTVVPALRALGVEALEVVVATHADADHVEGLIAVLGSLPVGVLVVGADEPERPLYRALVATAAARGVPVRRVRRGESFALGGARFEVLHPGAAPHGGNDDSVALLLRWRERPLALLLGDLSAAVEARLGVPPTPLLLAPHHGSPHSTSAALLRAAQPRLALVSVGPNRYGHPAPAVLERLEESGAEVGVTRDEGTLRVPFRALLARAGPPPGSSAAPDAARSADEMRSPSGSPAPGVID